MFVKLGALPGTYENGEKFSDVLAINHYGSETIPPRPVMRMAAKRTVQRNKKRIQAFLHNIIVNPRDVERDEVVLLTSLGQQSAAEAKRIIEAGNGLRRNAPSTVAKKGFNKPLYETGELEKHLSYEVSDE
jgi:hypothetical protein